MATTPEDLEELRETFEYNDVNGDGRIELAEFIAMLAALDADVSEREARIGFESVDQDHDGSIDFDEFLEWWQGER